MKLFVVVASLLILNMGSVWADNGCDLSDATDISDFQCLKQDGMTYVIVRCWQSTGQADPNCPHTIYNAWDGGMSTVDVYMFPCYSCGNPKGQVQQMVSYLQSYQCKYSTIWFDIEGPGTYWSNTPSNNVNFIQQLFDEAHALTQKFGVYTSASQWNPITGDWTGGSSYPLWYAQYNNEPNYNGFTSFGGWKSPSMKQYQGDVSKCSLDIDLDWYQ